MDTAKIRVLLVDDQRIVAEGIRRMLEGEDDILFDFVTDSALVIPIARSLRPDVILQDLVMPETDGFELLASYRRTTGLAETPVIMLSSREEPDVKAMAFERGADDYLVKMPDAVELLARIRMQGERRRAATEQRIARRRLEESHKQIAHLNARLEADNRGLENTLRRDRARLDAITVLGPELNRIQDFDRLMDRILTEARRSCEAEAGAVFTIDGDRLECRHIQNDALVGRRDRLFTQRVVRPLSLGTVAGSTAATGQAFRIADAYDIPAELGVEFDKGRDIDAGYKTRGLLSLPLKNIDGRIRGVLQLANPGGESAGREFSDEDQRVVEHIAALAAMAIERTAMTKALVMRMIAMAEVRDPTETGAHVQRVSGYSQVLYTAWARRHEVPEAEFESSLDRLATAAMLHDVGKIGIPDAILKKPGKLDDHEYAVMQRHTQIGARLFQGLRTDFDEVAREVAMHHHERWDGGGYPGPVTVDADLGEPDEPIRQGLAGEDTPLFARIVGLADVFDALLSRRSYKEAWDESQVVETLRAESGRHFDPELVEIALENLDRLRAVRMRWGG